MTYRDTNMTLKPSKGLAYIILTIEYSFVDINLFIISYLLQDMWTGF